MRAAQLFALLIGLNVAIGIAVSRMQSDPQTPPIVRVRTPVVYEESFRSEQGQYTKDLAPLERDRPANRRLYIQSGERGDSHDRHQLEDRHPVRYLHGRQRYVGVRICLRSRGTTLPQDSVAFTIHRGDDAPPRPRGFPMSTIPTQLRRALTAATLLVPAAALAQGGAARTPRADSTREATMLDTRGETAQARAIFDKLIASAPDPAQKAAAQRALALSYAFDGDCANAAKLEDHVIAYWVTRESAEPQNAFYQQGEMANEAARVCIDAGNMTMAEKYYRRGAELGLKEPAPKTHPKSLWDFRLSHALARLAARRGDKSGAARYVADARKILDSDSTMAASQERFFPYLQGYVALYTGDLTDADAAFTKTLATKGNENDPFFNYLAGETQERLGNKAKAKEYYQNAYDLATGHNAPGAFVRPHARKKLEV
jgi:tetratricopeptide (TPR) repeat protein